MIHIYLIQSLLEKKIGTQVSKIKPVKTGQISEAYFLEAAGQAYVVRFARAGMSDTLHKDRYVSSQLVSKDVPVAEFVCVDEFDDRTYALTRRAPGKILDDYTGEDYERLIPNIIETLNEIHQSDLEGTTGSGNFDARGRGSWASWSDYLRSVANEEGAEGGLYCRWHHLFDDSFLQRNIFDSIFAEMDSLIHYCPEARYLVHGDYGYDNVLAENGQITAVIDWANATFGDFLYDVAWLDLGQQWNYSDRFRSFYRERERKITNVDERLRCYYCHIALDSFKFYAKTNQITPYRWMVERIKALLNN